MHSDCAVLASPVCVSRVEADGARRRSVPQEGQVSGDSDLQNSSKSEIQTVGCLPPDLWQIMEPDVQDFVNPLNLISQV